MNLSDNQTAAFAALKAYLALALPGLLVVQGQANRVPEVSADDFVVMTPIRRTRLSTTIETAQDVSLTGSIAGTTLTVSEVEFGELEVGCPVFGIGVLDGTKITADISGGGGPGNYAINNSQNVASRAMAAGQAELQESTEITIQLDVHGENGSDNAQVVTAALRSSYAAQWFVDNFPGVAPLYADEAKQVPFLNAEKQYEDRWAIEAAFEVTPSVQLPQQFADQLAVTPLPADIIYRA